MNNRLLWVSGVLCSLLLACGDSGKKSPTEPEEDATPTPKTDIKSPEDARRELGELNIEYSSEAFIKAVENDDVLAVALFIDAGMDPNTGALVNVAMRMDIDVSGVSTQAELEQGWRSPGRTALMFAAMRGSLKIVQLLVEAGADINAREEFGRTALMFAAIGGSGSLGIVQLLVEAGADINAREESGRTALGWALALNMTDVANFLREHGAKE